MRRIVQTCAATFLLALLVVGYVAAQEDCPAFVADLLENVDELCSGAQRNEVCYGNAELAAEFWSDAEDIAFSEPADIVPAADVRAISGSALNLDDETMGVALMRLQASLPDTIPGQNVTFLLVGDVEVTNAVEPGEVPPPVEPVEVTATTNANLRSGPGTNFNVVGSTTSGAVLLAIGRNEAGDWLQVELEDGTLAWIFTDLVMTEGDLSTLPVVSGDEQAVFSPMQAFYFTAGVGEVECEGAPPDHLLVSVPTGLEASFTANGVEFTVGSTGALRFIDDDIMTITTFLGSIRIRVEGEILSIPPGYEIDVEVEETDEGFEFSAVVTGLHPYDENLWEFYGDLDEASIVEEDDFELPDEPEELGEGALQITLAWDNLADMDLAVETPDGEVIFYGSRFDSNGGQLDVDSNYPCGDNTFQVENIFWDEGDAPEGEYTVYVNQYSTCSDGNANWTLTVRAGDVIIYSTSGTGGEFEAFEFEFPPD
jgi:hypothetical protein